MLKNKNIVFENSQQNRNHTDKKPKDSSKVVVFFLSTEIMENFTVY